MTNHLVKLTKRLVSMSWTNRSAQQLLEPLIASPAHRQLGAIGENLVIRLSFSVQLDARSRSILRMYDR
jgi:hypothetical protein